MLLNAAGKPLRRIVGFGGEGFVVDEAGEWATNIAGKAGSPRPDWVGAGRTHRQMPFGCESGDDEVSRRQE